MIVGLDIGYSNLKVCFGEGDEPQSLVFPAGAAPVEHLPSKLRGGVGDEIRVQVDGKTWATAINPSRFEIWERSLHPDYAGTSSYRALFHTALLVSESEKIDLLVTGLPVSIYEDAHQALAAQLEGVHQVAAKRQVVVKKVQVVPQPIGGFVHALAEADQERTEILSEGRILVLDPGHFSFDWVLVESSALQRRSSGTSTEAMSAVLEEAALKIAEDYGGKISPDKIELALQENKPHVLLLGKRVDYLPYLENAAVSVAAIAAEKMRTMLRKDTDAIDAIILVGGGARWWKPIVEELFPQTPLVIPETPILANASGFYEIGRMS